MQYLADNTPSLSDSIITIISAKISLIDNVHAGCRIFVASASFDTTAGSLSVRDRTSGLDCPSLCLLSCVEVDSLSSAVSDSGLSDSSLRSFESWKTVPFVENVSENFRPTDSLVMSSLAV